MTSGASGADLFNPERYCFKVFGTPGSAAWGWQLAGHHVSLNFTIVSGRYIPPPRACSAPTGYRFVSSLDAAQRWPSITACITPGPVRR